VGGAEDDGLPCLTGCGWPKYGAPGYEVPRREVVDKA
jgi:hypothetical protein